MAKNEETKVPQDFTARINDIEQAITDMQPAVQIHDEQLDALLFPQMLVKRLTDEARMPEYATDGSACFDFFAPKDVSFDNASGLVHTGLAVAVPEGFALLIYSRSGMGFKSGVRLVNCVGVIDSDYRGEIAIGLTCDRPGTTYKVKAGDRVAQGLLVRVPQVELIEVDDLDETARGMGGFGSTGA